jgi:CBS domain-containing protein
MYSIALSENIGKLVSRDFITLDEDTLVAEAAKVMRDKDTSCVLVVRKDSKEPIGIVTERDMLYRVLAENMGPYKVPLKKIMSNTRHYKSSTADAISLMRSKHIRRLVVTESNKSGNNNNANLITALVKFEKGDSVMTRFTFELASDNSGNDDGATAGQKYNRIKTLHIQFLK